MPAGQEHGERIRRLESIVKVFIKVLFCREAAQQGSELPMVTRCLMYIFFCWVLDTNPSYIFTYESLIISFLIDVFGVSLVSLPESSRKHAVLMSAKAYLISRPYWIGHGHAYRYSTGPLYLAVPRGVWSKGIPLCEGIRTAYLVLSSVVIFRGTAIRLHSLL
jgi:hypothetical protein